MTKRRASWRVIRGEFRLRICIHGIETQVLLDTGFTDPSGRTGLQLNSSLYESLKALGKLRDEQPTEAILANGTIVYPDSAQVQAQLLLDNPSEPFGPVITIRAIDGGEAADNLIGVSFFHRFGCGKLKWDFADETMTIRMPWSMRRG